MLNNAIPQIWAELMSNGNFNEAWKLSDKVLKAGLNRDYSNLPRHFQSIWDGSTLNEKRVLIRCYHGLGDAIQFIRYAEMVKEISEEVIVWAQPELIDLLKTAKGIDKLLPLHNGSPDVHFDVDVEIMELPFIFRTTLETIPEKFPYLHVSPMIFPSEKISVGLVWQGGNWDQSRDVPFSTILQLFEIESVSFYILQANAESAGWKEGYGINPGEFNLYDYARVIKSLDVLITIDSMPAHLAGALNIPVWLMLPYQADWRWMNNREDSPWYPSMRLFRQLNAGDWQNVIHAIKNELFKL